MFASVVIDIASSNVDQYFEYHVNDSLTSIIKVGSRVKVEFGNAGKVILGFVLDLYENSQFKGEIKDIIEVLDVKPVLTNKQIELAKYLKDTCVCPLIRILSLMIPEGLKLKSMKYLELINSSELDASLMPLFDQSKVIDFNQSLNPYLSRIKKEISNGNLKISYDAKPKGNFKYVKKYYVDKSNFDFYYSSLRSINQRNVLEEMRSFDRLSKLEICETFGVSLYIVNALIKKGALKECSDKVSRVKDRLIYNQMRLKDSKNDQINQTVNALTGNNKPYLYLPKSKLELNDVLVRLIDEQLAYNKNVVVLCSDILSTYKYASVIYQALKLRCACINSNLSIGEYLDYYFEIINNEYQVVVTTLKGALLPYDNVGMYIMLDADSNNYFNDQSPRFDLKQVISHLSYLDHAKFIMCSFTPMINEYCYSLQNDIVLINNQKDVEHHPSVVIDLKDEFKSGNDSYLSKQVKEAFYLSKKYNKKSIVIINNKMMGYVMCKDCGNVEKCSKCGISLQYSEKNQMLICPHCGSRISFTKACGKCQSTNLMIGGIGIESLKININNECPDLRVLDIANNANFDDYLSKLDMIDEDEVDVILTTETFARALVAEGIMNVVVANIDSAIKAPLIYSSNKTYDLLVTANNLIDTNNGKIFIQTTEPNNQILKYFITDDFKGYLVNEIENRKIMNVLPYYQVNRIIIKAKYEEVFQVANTIKKSLISLINGYHYVIGPTYDKSYGGVVIIVKHNDNKVNEIYKKIYERYMSSTVTILFDLYPRNI